MGVFLNVCLVNEKVAERFVVLICCERGIRKQIEQMYVMIDIIPSSTKYSVKAGCV